jgi:hypothetical protein
MSSNDADDVTDGRVNREASTLCEPEAVDVKPF